MSKTEQLENIIALAELRGFVVNIEPTRIQFFKVKSKFFGFWSEKKLIGTLNTVNLFFSPSTLPELTYYIKELKDLIALITEINNKK